MTILSEAEALVYGDRQHDYSHPFDDYTRTAKIWTAILGVDVTAEQAILCMIGVKISRECHRPKRDNRVDGAGYFECLDRTIERRAELAEECVVHYEADPDQCDTSIVQCRMPANRMGLAGPVCEEHRGFAD